MERWLLIEHGDVLDCTGIPTMMPATSVLIRNDRIHSVSREVSVADVPRGEPLTVLDATGKTVMPGLIDAHCHMSYGRAAARRRSTSTPARSCAR